MMAFEGRSPTVSVKIITENEGYSYLKFHSVLGDGGGVHFEQTIY